MTFRELFDRYRAGTATPEERRIVDEELEKTAIINDHLFGTWEETAEPAPAAEFKEVKRSLRKRNAALVLTSVVLVIALLLSIPLVENVYFDPTQATWSDHHSDLEIALECYYNLFSPQQIFQGIWSYTDTGFGTWALELCYYDADAQNRLSFRNATVEKNGIRFPRGTLYFAPPELFDMEPHPPTHYEDWKTTVMERIEPWFTNIDEQSSVHAAVSFAEDLSVEELFELYDDYLIHWAAVRVGDYYDFQEPLIGIRLDTAVQDYGVNADYPALLGMVTADNVEQHFRSMVEYCRDYEQNTLNIGIVDDPSYYDKVFSELDENGLRFYGCYMTASAETYRELIAAGYITELRVLEVHEHMTAGYFAPSFGG